MLYASGSTGFLNVSTGLTLILYYKNIPILVLGNVTDNQRNKLNKLTHKIYNFYDIYCYAVIKNCVLSPVRHYLKEKNIKAKLVHMNLPTVFDIESPSEYEKQIRTHRYEKCFDKLYDFDKDYNEKVQKTFGPFWRGTGKKIKYIDFINEYCVVIDGIRQTFYQPDNAQNDIWFVGTSVSSGAGSVVDEHTIESFLQKIINEKLGGAYRVNNVVLPSGDHFGHMAKITLSLPIKDGDIVIFSDDYGDVFNNPLFVTRPLIEMASILDNRPVFQRPHDLGEIYIDLVHMNPRGYQKYAESIYTHLFDQGILENEAIQDTDNNDLDIDGINDGLKAYVDSLKQYRKDGNNGCIVMNCNPFTLGHRYLIEYASKQVDNLYIFVVEEDKSIFPFKDRFELVRQGIADLKNVIVIPSGRYIISAITFKAYFEKGEKQDVVVDTSQDLDIFGKYIAPALDLKVRFAGQEPLDNITRQYNNSMQIKLPQYGIKFVEIPRREWSGEVISASRVRKLLEISDFDTIAKIVPETTLAYLKKLKASTDR